MLLTPPQHACMGLCGGCKHRQRIAEVICGVYAYAEGTAGRARQHVGGGVLKRCQDNHRAHILFWCAHAEAVRVQHTRQQHAGCCGGLMGANACKSMHVSGVVGLSTTTARKTVQLHLSAMAPT